MPNKVEDLFAPEVYKFLKSNENFLTNLSKSAYEKEKCRGYLSVLNPATAADYCEMRLAYPIRFDPVEASLIRKLLAGTSPSRHLAIVDGWVWGLCGFPIGSKKGKRWLMLSFLDFEKWRVTADNKDSYIYNGKEYLDINTSKDEEDFIEGLKELTHGTPYEVKEIPSWRKLYQAAEGNQHGTMLVITSPDFAKEESIRLAEKNRGFCTQGPKLAVHSFIPYVRAMTGIDGALLFDTKRQCYGYGYILDGITSVPGRTDKGARFNSGLTYVSYNYQHEENKEYPILVCIFSEDGGSITISSKNFHEHQGLIPTA